MTLITHLFRAEKEREREWRGERSVFKMADQLTQLTIGRREKVQRREEGQVEKEIMEKEKA